MLYEITSRFNFELVEFNSKLYAFTDQNDFSETAVKILQGLAVKLKKTLVKKYSEKIEKNYYVFDNKLNDPHLEKLVLEVIQEMKL